MVPTTPAWVTVVTIVASVVAALLFGLAAQWYASRREARNRQELWRREDEHRQQQWQREDARRWLQEKMAAYARLTAAFSSWDEELQRAKTRRELDVLTGKQTELDWAELGTRAKDAREALAPVLFMAPIRVRALASLAVSHRNIALGLLRRKEGLNDGVLKWDSLELGDDVNSLREAMRVDLGLEAILKVSGSADTADGGGEHEAAQAAAESPAQTPDAANEQEAQKGGEGTAPVPSAPVPDAGFEMHIVGYPRWQSFDGLAYLVTFEAEMTNTTSRPVDVRQRWLNAGPEQEATLSPDALDALDHAYQAQLAAASPPFLPFGIIRPSGSVVGRSVHKVLRSPVDGHPPQCFFVVMDADGNTYTALVPQP